MIDLLSLPQAQWLAQALLHFLWQGALVALALRVYLAFPRSANQSYAASLGALVLMLCLPVATLGWLAQSPTQLQPVNSFSTTLAFAEYEIIQPDLNVLQPLLLTAWLTGVTVLGLRLLIAFVGTLWLRGERWPLPTEIEDQLGWLERRLQIAARGRVFLSSRVDEAIAIGCWRPLVLLPVAWATELPPSVLEAVIAHELAHIRRLDLWATWLQRLAETLLFYHPAVWWVSRRISIERELCCDELAVCVTSRRTEYAQALETIARRKRSPALALSTSFGGGNMNLLERVRSVLSGGTRQPLAWSSGAVAGLAPALAFAALMGWSALHLSALADDDEPEPKKVAKEKADQDPEKQPDENPKANPKPEPKSKEGARDDFNLDKFQPESDREAQLLAVIRKLQSQLKSTQQSSDEQRAIKEKMNYKAQIKDAQGALDDEARLIAEKQASAKEQGQKAYLEKKAMLEQEFKGKPAQKGDAPNKEGFRKGEKEPVKKGESPSKENVKFSKEPIKDPAKGEDNPKFRKEPPQKGDEPQKEKVNQGENLKEAVKFRKEPAKDPTKGEKGEFQKGEAKKVVNKGEAQKEFQKGEKTQKKPNVKEENPNEKIQKGEEKPQE